MRQSSIFPLFLNYRNIHITTVFRSLCSLNFSFFSVFSVCLYICNRCRPIVALSAILVKEYELLWMNEINTDFVLAVYDNFATASSCWTKLCVQKTQAASVRVSGLIIANQWLQTRQMLLMETGLWMTPTNSAGTEWANKREPLSFLALTLLHVNRTIYFTTPWICCCTALWSLSSELFHDYQSDT